MISRQKNASIWGLYYPALIGLISLLFYIGSYMSRIIHE